MPDDQRRQPCARADLRRGDQGSASPRRCAAIRRVVLMGEDVAEAGTTVQGADRAGRRVRQGAHHRHADLGGRLHRHRRRRRDDRHAADRRHHVRRLPDAHHGPAGQPGRQDPLHVGRQVEGADGHPRDDGRDAAVGGAALAVAARVAEPHPGSEGGRAVDAVRRQGPAQGGDPRRQPGRHLRGQDQLPQGQGAGAGGGLRHPARRRRREARGHATSRSSPRAAWCRWRSARPKLLEEVGISAEVVDPRTTWPLDEKTLDRVGQEDRRAASSWTKATAATASPAELAAVIAEGAFYDLDAPGARGSARCTCRFRSRRRSRT